MYENASIPNRPAFLKKVNEVAKDLGIPPEWLMAVMASETGNTFKSDISNIGCIARTGDANKCAVGLIQFMPDTAKGLGTSIQQLKSMNNVQQLEYVKKYFWPYRNKITRFVDLYLVTFYPVALNKPDSFVLGSERSMAFAKKVYEQNKGIDQNGDGLISVADFKKWIAKNKNIPEATVKKEVETIVKAEKYTKRNWLPITATFAITGTALFLLFRYRKVIIKSLNK